MEMRVGGRAGALVRAGVEKTTAIVGTLARDTAVTTSGAAGVAGDRKPVHELDVRRGNERFRRSRVEAGNAPVPLECVRPKPKLENVRDGGGLAQTPVRRNLDFATPRARRRDPREGGTKYDSTGA